MYNVIQVYRYSVTRYSLHIIFHIIDQIKVSRVSFVNCMESPLILLLQSF